MRKRVGAAVCIDSKLSYYVIGSERQGYGVEIERRKTQIETARALTSADAEGALVLARQLWHCGVVPHHLKDIEEDLKISNNQ